MDSYYIIRYGEIALKSHATRSRFESRLMRNIKSAVGDGAEVIKQGPRIIVHSTELINDKLSKVYGVVSFSPASKIEAGMNEINEAALKMLPDNAKSFRISTQRINKSLKQTSQEINRDVGEYVYETSGVPVKLKGADADISIELVGNDAYLFLKRFNGPGGLPVGVEGSVTGVLTDSEDSLLACLLIMRRGCELQPVMTSDKYLRELSSYALGYELKPVSIKEVIPEAVKGVAREQRSLAIVIPERSLSDIKEWRSTGMLILTPLLVYDMITSLLGAPLVRN